jgi:hypothetical protein
VNPGSSDGDLVYTRISPCRIVDTRAAGGRLGPGETRHFRAAAPTFADQGGSNDDCAVLSDAPVVVLNIVAVNPDAAGFLTAYAYGDVRPNTSNLNYDHGDLVANEVAVRTASSANYDFSVFSLHGVDLVIDVAGYFATPVSAEPSCETSYGDWVVLSKDQYGRSNATCASALQARVSGGCNWDHVNLSLVQYGQLVGHPDAQGGFTCDGDNPVAGGALRFRAKVVCCGTPGM